MRKTQTKNIADMCFDGKTLSCSLYFTLKKKMSVSKLKQRSLSIKPSFISIFSLNTQDSFQHIQYINADYTSSKHIARGVDAGNRNTRYARGLVPSLEAHQVVCQDGVRDFAGNTQILRLTCVRSPSSQTKRRPS